MKTFLSGKIFILSLMLAATLNLSAQTLQDIRLIKNNYIRSIIGEPDEDRKKLMKILSTIPREKEVSDQNIIELQQFYPVTNEETQALVETMSSNGSWTDINYADTKRSGWEPKIHTERILKLTKHYYKNKGREGNDKIVLAIRRAMGFWFDQKLICKNWWYNQIGIPRTLGPAFLLFENEMSDKEKQNAIEVMKNAKLGMTGQNKVWMAGNVLICGLLRDDWKLVVAARDAICQEITLGREEGIKGDWSFHQHGAQQQFGNYGLSFFNNMSFYAELFANTSVALGSEQQKVLASFLLKGYRWIVWRGHWDVNALNRQLFRNADVDKTLLLLFSASSLKKGSNKEDAKAIGQFIESSISDTRNSFIGNKPFYCSDLTIHRTAGWMASLRMASKRVIGTEQVNEDNTKGYYMADGALFTYVRGDEYHNIFPFWDWRRIPGITTYESHAAIPNANSKGARNDSYFVGGSSNGKGGITAMQLNRNKLKAHKAWIFTDNYVICLGTGIQADSTATIITSIDQRFSKGNVWTGEDRRYYHDNTGYIVIEGDTCVVSTESKQGQWSDFMGMYKPAMLESEIFSLYLKHRRGVPASYTYLILPGCTQKQVKRFDTDEFKVIRNDKQAQAVKIDNAIYLAIYEETEIKSESNGNIRFSTPGTYVIRSKDGTAIASNPFLK